MSRVSGLVLVTGSSGFVGGAVVNHLRDSGFQVRGSVRRDAGPGEVSTGDLSAETDWSTALHGVDTVVHCAAMVHIRPREAEQGREVNTMASISLARQAAASGVQRLVFISSLAVTGNRASQSLYALSKLEAEAGLRRVAAEIGLEVVIIRPPIVIGQGGGGNVALLAKITALGLPTPFGLTRNRRDVVSLPTLCQAIEKSVSAKESGQTVAVIDATLSTREMIDRVAEIHGHRKPVHLPVPRWLLGAVLRGGLRSQLLGDLEIAAQTAL